MTLDVYVASAAPPLSDLYYVRLFSPSERRERVTAVLACAAEIEGCVRDTHEPYVAEMKLSWWEEEIELLARGTPRHPITIALAESGTLAAVPTLWLDLIASARRELDFAPHASADVLHAHCREAAAVHELLALAFDAGVLAREHARALGAAIVNARIVVSARSTAARGQISLPLDLLAAAGLAPTALTGDWPPQALDLLARLGSDVRVQLAGARDAIPPAECPQLQPCLIMAALQDARLAALDARRYEHTSDPLKPLSRLWIAWRAARRAMRSP